MATGLSSFLADAWLGALGNNVSFVVSSAWVQLHVGDPGVSGSANVADEVSRRQVSFAVASGGVLVSDADVSWVNVAGSQTVSHFSVWDSVSGGNFLFSGTMVASPYVAGDTFTVAAGALSVGLVVVV